MNSRSLGATGLVVSEIGLGAGPLGDDKLDDRAAERLVLGALDLGVTLIDTAPSYGRSEHRIGAALAASGRRADVVLSTKLGYGVPDVPEWTGPCITAGIELALERLQTTWIDIAHLHSCSVAILAREDVIDALEAAVRAGKVRVAAYSGDNEALAWAIESNRFGAVQCSLNIADQRALDRAIPTATARGIGVIAKRPLANAAWRDATRPEASDRGTYWDRLRAMDCAPTFERALGFTLAQPIASALVGTARLPHLHAMIASPPLDEPAVDEHREAFRKNDESWDGVI